jgi:hypothetical protein
MTLEQLALLAELIAKGYAALIFQGYELARSKLEADD